MHNKIVKETLNIQIQTPSSDLLENTRLSCQFPNFFDRTWSSFLRCMDYNYHRTHYAGHTPQNSHFLKSFFEHEMCQNSTVQIHQSCQPSPIKPPLYSEGNKNSKKQSTKLQPKDKISLSTWQLYSMHQGELPEQPEQRHTPQSLQLLQKSLFMKKLCNPYSYHIYIKITVTR